MWATMSATSPARIALLAGEAGFALVGLVSALFGTYLVVLAVAALISRHHEPEAPGGPPSRRIAVLVPAHNEASVIEACVRSLRSQTYPADLYDVIVVADNCTDRTAETAEASGAHVLVRDDVASRGKGHALRWAIERVLAAEPPFDAVAVVDADGEVGRDFLAMLARPLDRGADAVQGESLLSADGSAQSILRASAFLLVNRVRPTGRAALGLPCTLEGTAMLFSRRLLLAHPWDAFTNTEDLEYALHLRAGGVRPVFVAGAVFSTPVTPAGKAAARQRLRWTGGKLWLARTWGPRLLARAVRERRADLFDTAFELIMPPMTLLAALVGTGTLVAAGAGWAGALSMWAAGPWLVAAVAVPAYVVIGLRAGHAPRGAYRALTVAPLFVGTALLHAPRLASFRPGAWERPLRSDERAHGTPGD